MDLEERRFQFGLLGASGLLGGIGVAASGAIEAGLVLAAAGLAVAWWGLVPTVVSTLRGKGRGQGVGAFRSLFGIASFEFPRPDNWKAFETFCLKVFRRYVDAPDLQKYAREGQAQGGVDLIGTTRDHTRCGIQCKRVKKLTKADVVAEVDKAKNFEPPLDRYIIATIAKRDPEVQRLAAQLTEGHAEQGLFSVAVYAWEDIEEILKVEAGLFQEIYGMPLPPERALPAPDAAEVAAPEQPPPPSDTHREIDEAFEFVNKGQPEVTIELLERIRRRRWDTLSPRERYRVIANIGNAKLTQGDNEGAAHAYLEAVQFQPHEDDARALEALAHHVVKDRERAHELAVALCHDRPNLGRAHMLRIRTASDDCSLDDLMESVPVPVRSHPEVALALHDRAVAAGRLEDAEDILREYADEGHGWAQLTLALATTILQREFTKTRITSGGPIGADHTRLTEAEDLFGKVLERVSEGDPDNLRFGAHLNRGTCRQLLGRLDEAQDDYLTAWSIDPADERVAVGLARSAHPCRGNLEEAVRVLDRFLEEHESPLASFVLAEYLLEREGPGDMDRAAALLEPLLAVPEQFEESQREDLVRALAHLYVTTDRAEAAVELVRNPDAWGLRPVVAHAIAADIHRRTGSKEEALAEARAASDALGESSDWNDTRRVALVLRRLEQFEDAFRLWRRIVQPEFVGQETLHLLACAGEAGEHDFIRDFCRQLREAGFLDRRTVLIEVQVLTLYNQSNEARAVFEEYLEVKPDDKIVRLHKTALALRQSWDDLVERDLDTLPSADEVDDPEMGRLVTDILRSGPEPVQAVDYAYALYRRFPDGAEAQNALIVALHAPGPAKVDIEKPVAVGPGTAVCYREVDSDETQWLVVEDADAPSLTRGEYAVDEGLVPVLLGKVVGDEFPFAEDGIRDRLGTVVDIQDKRVYRANELMIAWPQRFPDKPYFVPVPIKESESPSLEDFAEMKKVMERLNEPRDAVKRLYVAGNIPISSFAKFMNLSVFDAVTSLAADVELPVRACRGSTQDTEEAVLLLDGVESVVLGPSAVATLALLEQESLIDLLPFGCLVTEGTLQEIHDLARDDLPTNQATGYAGVRDGEMWFQELDQEAEARRRQRLREFAEKLEHSCEVIGGGDLARVEVSIRERFTEYVVQASAESAVAANARGAAFWSDDHLFWEMVKGDLPGQRVWTQAVFIWANLRGLVEREDRSRITARLLSFGYFFTSSNPMTVIDTCEAANWSCDDPNLRAVLADFGNTAWDYETALGFTAQTVARVWRDAPSQAHARAVTARILGHLAEREGQSANRQFPG